MTDEAIAPPPPAPARVWPRVSSIASRSFDVVTETRRPLRDASLYIGLLGFFTIGPATIAVIFDALERRGGEGLSGWTWLAIMSALLAAFAIAIESRIIGLTIVGGSAAGRAMTLHEALRRSRTVFWRVVGAWFIIQVIVGLITQIVSGLLDTALGPEADFAEIGAAIVAGVLTAPLAYVEAGIVLGNVGVIESIRRSIRLARARLRLAVLVSMFGLIAQFLILVAALAAVDIVVRLLEPLRPELETLDVQSAGGFILISAGALVALVAFWTLTFTVGALASAPQVVAFLALTGYSGGLDLARDAPPGGPSRHDPAWISRPMVIGVAVALLAATLAIVAGSG